MDKVACNLRAGPLVRIYRKYPLSYWGADTKALCKCVRCGRVYFRKVFFISVLVTPTCRSSWFTCAPFLSYPDALVVTCCCVTRLMGHLLLTDSPLVGTSLMVVCGPADTCLPPSSADRGHYRGRGLSVCSADLWDWTVARFDPWPHRSMLLWPFSLSHALGIQHMSAASQAQTCLNANERLSPENSVMLLTSEVPHVLGL